MKSKIKRISAIVGIVILVLMYVLLLIFAVLDVPNWQRFFFACMGATILIPFILRANIYVYEGTMSRRKLAEGEEEIAHGKKTER